MGWTLGDRVSGCGYQTTTTADIVTLIPGDPKGGAWEAADPYFRFQPSGKGADATNPCNADTDNGGVKDSVEVGPWGTDPNLQDRQPDGGPRPRWHHQLRRGHQTRTGS